MNAQTNPYQAPSPVDEVGELPPDRSSWGDSLGVWSFWGGCVLTGIGLVAYFTPNSPPLGFMLIGCVLFWFAVVASQRYRIRSALGGLFCVFLMLAMLLSLRAQAQAAALQRARAQAEAAKRAAESAARDRALERMLGEDGKTPNPTADQQAKLWR